jgi:rfaE bifunctional protein kinase chain/domain
MDETGRRLKSALKGLGIEEEDLFLLEASDRPTTIKTRILAGNQQVCRLDREKRLPITPQMELDFLKFIERSISRIQGIIFSDYDKGVVTPELIRKTVELARRNGVFIAVDPQVTHFHYYKNVDVLTPNHHEAGRFLGLNLKSDEEVEEAGREIIRRLDARMALITRGEKGMSLVESPDMRCRHFPTRAREVFDVTGAGDTVISIFTLAMICGATTEEAVHLSNTGAGIVVGKIGAATVQVEDLIQHI